MTDFGEGRRKLEIPIYYRVRVGFASVGGSGMNAAGEICRRHSFKPPSEGGVGGGEHGFERDVNVIVHQDYRRSSFTKCVIELVRRNNKNVVGPYPGFQNVAYTADLIY